MDPDSSYVCSVDDTISIATANDTISIATTNDNISQNFFYSNIPSQIGEPVSLDPRIRRSNSVDSRISEQPVNPYFQHLQPIPTEDAFDSLKRTKTFLCRDWSSRTERRSSWLEENADLVIQVIKDSRSKLTKLITDVAVLFPYLKQMEILTTDDCERIDHNRLRSLKTDHLIDIIITRGIKGVVYFCESLKLHYNHLYVTLKHIFEINGIEIDVVLDNSGRKAKVISEIFRSIEDIMGPKFAQEKLDAQQLLDSISAVKMDNVSSQDINELREKYIELQNHYLPIQHIIDTLTNDITNKYICLTSENEAALAAIDKLHTENREMYEKMKTLHLRLELQQDELDRRDTNCAVENNALYQRLLNLDLSDEKMEVVRLNQLLQQEKNQTAQLTEQIKAIRNEKDEYFDANQKLLVENAKWQKRAETTSLQGSRTYDDNTLKSNEHITQLEALSDNLKQKNKDISEALSIISPKKSTVIKVIAKPSISIDTLVRQHLSQSLEIGVFFSDNLDRSLVRSFQPGDRILRINDIKLTNLTSTNFPQVMMQHVENSLKLLIAPGPNSMGKITYEEHNFTISQDEMSRCPSPCTFVEGGRLTPVPDYQRRISNQSHEALTRTGTLTAFAQPPIFESSAFTRGRAATKVDVSKELLFSSKNVLDSCFKNMTVSSCPPTPISDSKQEMLSVKTDKRSALKSITDDNVSDTLSQESDHELNPYETVQRPTVLNILAPNTRESHKSHRYHPAASPMFAKEFPGAMGSLEVMPDLFNTRTDTGITGMIIFPRSETTSLRPGQHTNDVIINKDQICTTISNDFFLKHVKISGGFGNPFFLSTSKDLNQFRLKSGQKIYQINDISTEYLTYEMFIEQCKQSPSITLFISMNPSPDFKPDELSLRDHFYVIAHFTTNYTRMKGELFVSPSCVYLVTDTFFLKDNTSKENRYWHVTRIDPRNCNTIEKGVIPSDLWLDYSMNRPEESFEVSIESRGPQSINSSSVSELEVFDHDIGYYYALEGVKNKQENDFTKSPFSCYTLVTRQDHLPQPVILFDYHWEEFSEKLASLNGSKSPSLKTVFQLITPITIETVDSVKNAELEAKHRASELLYYKGSDGKGRIVEGTSLRSCIESQCTPILLCPIDQIYNAPLLVDLNPIVIRLKFKYKYKFDAPIDQRFHFDDMLSIGLSEEKYLKKLVNMIDSNRVQFEWKAVVIES